MSDLTREAVPVQARPSRRSWRGLSLVAALALTLACVLGTPAAHAAPTPRVAAVASPAPGAALQIDVRAIVCPILNSLASGPFSSFIAPIINSLRVAFGCVST
jgi:hypothetical protein